MIHVLKKAEMSKLASPHSTGVVPEVLKRMLNACVHR